MGEEQVPQAVHALSMEKWFHQKFRGGLVATIHEQIIRAPGRIQKNRIAAAEGENRDARIVSMIEPLEQADGREQADRGGGPVPNPWRKQLSGRDPEQKRVISD